jgi:hypothetical protein
MNDTQGNEISYTLAGSRAFSASETLGKLSEALAKAQGEIKGAKKDSDNPFFHSHYADLASVLEACREPLSKNGLAIVQLPGQNGEGLFIDSVLLHSSGEWISGRLHIKPVKEDPQGIGSAVTYGRRYGLQALVGIAPEDDDGEAAMGRQASREADARTHKDAPVKVSGRKANLNAQRATEERASKGLTAVGPPDKRPPAVGDEIPMFNGPKHTALAARLKAEGIAEDDLMAAAKFVGLIPATAKAFRLMSETTAAQFVDDPEVVGVIMENWRQQRVVTP